MSTYKRPTPKSYHIVRRISIADLEEEISDYVEDGWRPIGGVSSYQNEENDLQMFMQAVLNESKLNKRN